jgi:hypothetical protein
VNPAALAAVTSVTVTVVSLFVNDRRQRRRDLNRRHLTPLRFHLVENRLPHRVPVRAEGSSSSTSRRHAGKERRSRAILDAIGELSVFPDDCVAGGRSIESRLQAEALEPGRRRTRRA